MENMPVWATVVIGIITLFGGSVGTMLINMYQSRKKAQLDETEQTSKIKISENEQAFKIYKDLVDILKGEVTTISASLEKLEAEHLKAREDNASLRTENRLLKEELVETKTEMAELKKPRG